MSDFHCTVARTEAELDAIYRLRHRIYIQQMGLLPADHPYCQGQRLTDPYDAYSQQLALWRGDALVGTIRVTLGADGPLEIEACRPIYAHVSDRATAVEFTRLMIDRPHRCTQATARLLVAAFREADRLGGRTLVGAGKLGSLGRYYRRMGLRCVDPEPFAYPVVPGALYQLLVANLGAPRSLRRLLWRTYVRVGGAIAGRLPGLSDRWYRRDLNTDRRTQITGE